MKIIENFQKLLFKKKIVANLTLSLLLPFSRNIFQISWEADFCDTPRPFICGFIPADSQYDAALSRGKRNLNVLVNSQRSIRDPLEALNERQGADFHPKVNIKKYEDLNFHALIKSGEFVPINKYKKIRF